MRASMRLLAGCCLLLIVCQVSAMAPPAWAQPGTKVTYQAALTPYYAIEPDDPMDRWVHHEGTGVFGYLTDTITAGDAAGGYSGDSVVVSGIDGGILYTGSWSYLPGDPGMGLVPFWVDLDSPAFSPEFMVLEGPLELAGTEWNAQVYYYANLGTSFDIRYVVDKESGLVLIKNAGLTGANNQMQREIYILQSLETGYPGSGMPENDTFPIIWNSTHPERGMPENVTSPLGEIVGNSGWSMRHLGEGTPPLHHASHDGAGHIYNPDGDEN
ncbi:hypothetical protein [Methanoculleus formosensis]|nr:hypothetical protein [Methanoculleus sp. Afa-1]